MLPPVYSAPEAPGEGDMSGNCSKEKEEHDSNSTAFSSKLSPSADICVGLAILSVVFFSVLGNGLVLVICYRRRKKMVGSELLCVNLAVVDFFCCIFFYPLSIMSSFNHMWLGDNVTCVYYGLGCYVFGLCGMFTIAAISVIRYLKTCHSLSYVCLEGGNIRLACFFIWLVAAGWSCFPLFGWGAYVPEPYGLSCTVAWRAYHTSTKDAFYVIFSFACFTLIPVLLIVVSQGLILYKVSRFSYALSSRGIRNNLRCTEKRLTMMFFCISLGFIIAWAPYTIVSFLFIFHKSSHYMAPEGFVFPALFAKSSHIYNPFLYFYFNKTFQKELRSLLVSLCPQLGENRVGVHLGLNHSGPQTIHIQLKERHMGRKIRSTDKANRKSKASSIENGPVYICWGSTPSNKAPVPKQSKKVQNFGQRSI